MMSDKTKLPIGVIDSGLGGLSVLRELIRIMPNESYIYFGDSANAPYGTKSHDEILKLTKEASENLYKEGIKALVVACNTATSVAINDLRSIMSEIPVIGLEPALKPACEKTSEGTVVVMATNTTLSEEKFLRLKNKYEESRKIVSLPAPALVEFVEKGILCGSEIHKYLEKLFEPYKEEKLAGVVLGCTHFPLVAGAIAEVIGSQVPLFDGGIGAAAETKRQLEAVGLLNRSTSDTAKTDIRNSTEDTRMLELSKKLLNL